MAAVGFSCGRDDETVPAEVPAPTEYTWVDLSEPRPESPATRPVEVQPPLPVVASQPVKPPTTAPASAPAAQPLDPPGKVPAFTPLIDAAPGEWVRYTAMDERLLEYRILSVELSQVTTQVRVYQQGHLLGQPARRVDAMDRDPMAVRAQRAKAQRTARRTTVRAAGRSWSAICYEDRWEDEEVSYVRRTWVSKEVPVFGTIWMELYGAEVLEARLELQAFGDQ